MGWKRGGFWPDRLLLAGVGLGFLFSAILMLLMSISSTREQGVPCSGYSATFLLLTGPLFLRIIFITAGLCISLLRAKSLNALVLGDDFHTVSGFPEKGKIYSFCMRQPHDSSFRISCGMIGFIGLLIPHIARFMVGSDNRILVPVSAIGGGMLLCIADLIGKSVLSPTELPAGIITAIIGAP